MKPRKSVLNRFGQHITVGARVSFVRVNDSRRYFGDVKRIETHSAIARAYGPQVFFSDSPFCVGADDCTQLPEHVKNATRAAQDALTARTFRGAENEFHTARANWFAYCATL